MGRWLALLACLALLSACIPLTVQRLPKDTDGALLVRCYRWGDSNWLMMMWVWSKSEGAVLAEHPGNIMIDSTCHWSVTRDQRNEADPLPP
jgi:hypothetical protein